MFLLSLFSILPLLCLFLTVILLRWKRGLSFYAPFHKIFNVESSHTNDAASEALNKAKIGESSSFFISVIDASLIWSAALWAETNLFSLFDLIRPFPIICFWLFYLLFLLFLFFFLPSSPPRRTKPRSRLLVPLYILCACCLFTAIVYPPNNWDVMSYHLPRVMQWLQNHSLSPFFTAIPRQIGMPPFNSMIALQILSFGGWDHFVNLAQWFAYIACIIGAGSIAGLFGGRSSQVYSCIFMACIPGAISQASTIESTIIVTYWLIAFVYIFLLWRGKASLGLAIKAGLCLGLAILSKGSAYPIALPFVIYIIWLCLRHPSRRFLQGCLMALLIITLNMPHLLRTYSAYGSIVGGTEKNIIYHPTAGTFLLNSIYNFLVHEPLLIKISGDFFYNLPGKLGLDKQDKDLFPWGGLEMFPAKINFSEAYGENPLDAIFLFILLMAIIFHRFKPPALYTILVFFSFFAYFFFLTWHPWTGRIHTSLFALASPLAGLFITSWPKAKMRKWMALILYLYAFLPLLFGDRPVLSLYNPAQHFSYNDGLASYIPPVKYKTEIVKALNFLREQKPAALGLIQVDNALEYPVWAALRKEESAGAHIVHLDKTEDNVDDRPAFIWIQEGDNKGALLPPKILKLEKGVYKEIHPL